MYTSIEQSIRVTVHKGQTGETIRVARPQNESYLLATLTSAFINDPPARWLFSEPAVYLSRFPRFARAFGSDALGLGTAWHKQGQGPTIDSVIVGATADVT